MSTLATPGALPNVPLPSNDGGVGTFIGWTGLGMGVIITYAAVKGVSVFGPEGIITNALTKGQLTHVVNGKAVPATAGKSNDHTFSLTGGGSGVKDKGGYETYQPGLVDRAIGIVPIVGPAWNHPPKALATWSNLGNWFTNGLSAINRYNPIPSPTSVEHGIGRAYDDTIGKALHWIGL